MSIKVTNWVWIRSESRNGARLVLLALADRADDNGFAWPSIDDLCERTNLSPRAVQRAIAELVKLGELHVESGGGRRVRNRYTITPKPRTSAGVTDEKPRQSDAVSPEETPSFDAETPSFATETPSFEHGNPVKSAGEPSLEPSEEPSGNRHNYPTPKRDRQPAVRPVTEVAADRYPDWVTTLQDALSAAGINVPWKFEGDDMLLVHNDVKRLGIPLMVELALNAKEGSTKPIFSSRWFYPVWRKTPNPVPVGTGPTDGSNVVAFNPARLTGTDAKVAGWLALPTKESS